MKAGGFGFVNQSSCGDELPGVSKLFCQKATRATTQMFEVRNLTYCDCFGICYMPPNQQVFREYMIFKLLTKRLCGRMQCLASRIWPAGRSLETPELHH